MDLTPLPGNYIDLIEQIKREIKSSRVKAALAVNSELIMLYWRIGRALNDQANEAEWGSKVLEKAASELRAEFPDMSGISHRNLKFMRQFAAAWPGEIGKQPVSQIPWGHNILLLQRLNDPTLRKAYAQWIIENGWSRAVLASKLDSNYHQRIGQAPSNFKLALPPENSDLAEKLLTDPHDLSHLDLIAGHSERDLEDSLVGKIQEFMQHFGRGSMAFMGRQWHIEVGGDDFYIDLLFYHVKLHRYVVIELKADKFDVRDLAQLKFYTTIIDKQIKTELDGSTVGLLICREKNEVVAQYAIEGYNVEEGSSPLAIASYAVDRLNLPSLKDIEKALEE